MIIVIRPGTAQRQLDHVRERVESAGVRTHLSACGGRPILVVVKAEEALPGRWLLDLPEVESILPHPTPYKLAARGLVQGPTTVRVGIDLEVTVGGRELVVIAGPCSVEGREMLGEAADAVRAAGARMLRGGAFKPRTSPYSFQGLGRAALEMLAEVRARTRMPVVTEVMDTRQVELVSAHADVLQVGARNMQNFALLSALGSIRRPVLLKRGLCATVEELLLAAEHIMSRGNGEVILCERGIRTYETATRNTLDLAAVPVLKRETHLPVIVDPSHAAGRADLVAPLAMGAVAAGADGLIVEVHPRPAEALSDGRQSLRPDAFAEMMRQLRAVAAAVGRVLPGRGSSAAERAA
ncbi:MAG: 3-deoxy-7-phosphoheptulonate synthase [Acidobacteriota bacterium]